MGKTGIAQDTSKSTKALAKQIARQMAQEPLEVLKQAGKQVGGVESVEKPQGSGQDSTLPSEIDQAEKAKIETQSRRQLQALENELKDIRERKKQAELVKAQQEVQIAEARKEQEKQKGTPKASSKRSRRFLGFGRKTQAEKQQTRVEKPLPPSG